MGRLKAKAAEIGSAVGDYSFLPSSTFPLLTLFHLPHIYYTFHCSRCMQAVLLVCITHPEPWAGQSSNVRSSTVSGNALRLVR
jgi:hypothetical protein